MYAPCPGADQRAAKLACFNQKQLVTLPYLPLHSLFARRLHDATAPSTIIAYSFY